MRPRKRVTSPSPASPRSAADDDKKVWAPSSGQKLALGALLSFMYAMRSLSTTYSKDDTDADGVLDTFPYNPNSAVMTTEFCKLIIAGSLFSLRLAEARQGLIPKPKTTFQPDVVAKFAIPALLYMLSNNLGFLALRYLDTPTYQVMGCALSYPASCVLAPPPVHLLSTYNAVLHCSNAGIPIVACVQRVALGSRKAVVQWIGVLTLCLGMMVIGADKVAQSTSAETSKDYDRLMKGLAFLLMLEVVSSGSGVYTEFLLKNLDIDINYQSILMYSWGITFSIAANVVASGASINAAGEFAGGSFFAGFDARTWCVVFVNAGLGQVVSRVMKYLDNVAKFFCASFGMILVTIISSFVFDFKMSLLFSVGSFVVIVAGSLYIMPATMLLKQA